MSNLNIKTHVEGRYPREFVRFDPRNIEVGVSIYEDDVVFRLDDKENLDMWLQLPVSREQLEEILRQMDERKNEKEAE